MLVRLNAVFVVMALKQEDRADAGDSLSSGLSQICKHSDLSLVRQLLLETVNNTCISLNTLHEM